MGGRPVRVRLITALSFTVGVFLGTIVALFLVLTLRSIDDDYRGENNYFDERGAASVKMPSMPHIQTEIENDGASHRLTNSDATTAASVVGARELVTYSAIIPKSELKRRGLAAHKTWASDLGNRVRFYLVPGGADEEIDFAYKWRMPVISLGSTARRNWLAQNSPAPQGIITAWMDVCERELGKYQWYTKVQDTTYLRRQKIEKLLMSLSSSEALFIGLQVLPGEKESEELGLRSGEGYCMEMGYILSARTLQMLCPMLKYCQENAQSENEDVEIARCIRRSAGINCTSAQEV